MQEIRDSNLIDLFLWLLRRRRRFRIVGESMSPLLQPDDEVLVDIYAYKNSSPAVGDIVVLQHPQQQHLQIIKRVTQINKLGAFFVEGDNPLASTDSHNFGFVKAELILGKVVCFFN